MEIRSEIIKIHKGIPSFYRLNYGFYQDINTSLSIVVKINHWELLLYKLLIKIKFRDLFDRLLFHHKLRSSLHHQLRSTLFLRVKEWAIRLNKLESPASEDVLWQI